MGNLPEIQGWFLHIPLCIIFTEHFNAYENTDLHGAAGTVRFPFFPAPHGGRMGTGLRYTYPLALGYSRCIGGIVTTTITPTPDEQALFGILRIGIWPDYFPGVNFAEDPGPLSMLFPEDVKQEAAKRYQNLQNRSKPCGLYSIIWISTVVISLILFFFISRFIKKGSNFGIPAVVIMGPLAFLFWLMIGQEDKKSKWRLSLIELTRS